ncbi:hypothetical protein CTN06_07170 [Pectobacterium zantedeschiae]|uniref:Uncharacterized protein n=1 Tax=Pectobacterium zantedeschiae TaxID=2034769 RepID=A0A9X8JIN5_9GAMM|nr:hypothetical protein CLR69_00445 [Pectobacterium zantedeschiae]RYC49215.1 hypothetical protein CTN06_07170 [Pectobacterium zantedeschiae]
MLARRASPIYGASKRVSGGPNRRTLKTKEPRSGIISRQTAWVHRAAATERPVSGAYGKHAEKNKC